MTDTGQVPAEGLPENAGMVEQPGAPAHGAYTYLSETTAEDEDLLLLPGAQGAWGNEVAPPAPEPVLETVHEPGPHEMSGRDSGSVDLSAVRTPGPTAPPAAPRRPLHLGPPIPDTSASPVRSLADRGPAGAPVRQPSAPATGPEYLDVPPLRETPPQGAAPWGPPAAQPAAPAPAHFAAPAAAPVQGPVATGPVTAETVVPAPVPAAPEPEAVGVAQAVVARVATEAIAATAAQTQETEQVSVGSGIVDPGQLLGAALIAEGEQDIADADAAAEQAPEAGAGSDAEQGPDPEPAAVPAVEQTAEATPAAEVPQGPEGGYEGGHAEQAATAPEEAQAAQPPVAAEPPVAVEPPVAAEPSVVAEPSAVAEAASADEAAAPAEVTPVAESGPSEVAPVAEAAGAAAEQIAGTNAAEADAADVASPQGASSHVTHAVEAVPVAEAGQADVASVASVASAAEVIPAEVTSDGEASPTGAAPVAEADAATVPEADAADTTNAVDTASGSAVAAPEAAQVAEAVPVVEAAPATEAPAVVEPPAPVAEPAQVSDPADAPGAAQTSEVPAPAPVPEAQAPEDGDVTDAGSAPVADATAQAPEPAAAEVPETSEASEPAATVREAPAVVSEAAPAPEAPAAEPTATPEPAQLHDASAAPAETVAVTSPEPVAAAEPRPEAEPAPQAHPAPEQADPSAQVTQPQPEPVAQSAPEAPAPAHHVGDASHHPDAPADAPAPLVPTPAPAPAPETSVAPEPSAPQADQPLGQFVPVEGAVPATPHLAPAPPHPEPAAPTAADALAATVPGPRAADQAPAPATPDPEPHADADPDPEVAQSPEDLETRAADQEESAAPVEEARESTGPAAPAYDDAEREAVLKVMRERRDIRNGFRSDPIPHEVLLRVLEAAHTAPSVGHSQPWDFVVIRSAETRRAMHDLAMRQRDAYAKSLPKGRAKQFKELKIEAILDTPVNIVVTADPTRGGRHTLGRHTQPQMAPYSSALAVENLWLAARAEGLGVGWVSFFDEREMVRALGLPEHLEVVAYLCVGYVDEFPAEPELMQAGWAKRRPLSWVVHEETYGRRALPGEDPHDLLAETVAGIRPLDAKALGEAWERQKRMTKPAGALGMLEIISAQLSGLSRQCPPPIPEPAAVAIFAGDHGVHAQGVTPWPQEVTAQMVANFLGGGAVCNAFASQVGAEVCVVDVGVAADLPATPGLLPRKVRAGTSDMTTGPAMTREEAKQAIEVGIETARDLVAAGNKALLTGEMGIANTTASAALISVFTGADPSEVTGRGTGINDETLARKTEVVRRALEVHQPDPADPIGVLAAIGGFEHAAMVGLLLGGASLRTPVILDGVSAGAAALVARAIAPEVLAACIAGHRSAEPGHVAALNKLGLRPLVDLDLRLGEGTGALLALPLVQSTARAMHEVATFDSAGVTEK